MKLIFGLCLDGPSYPGLLADHPAVIGQVQCGPMGLLQILETRLGLVGKWETEPYRIELYRRRLLAADDGERFYSRSLQADSHMTSQTLLAWRDELVRCGWNFTIDASLPPRLNDLAAVETATTPQAPAVPPGFADRFRKVLTALPSTQLHIAKIILADRRPFFDSPWVDLFRKLEASGINISEATPPACKAAGDLGKLQDALKTNTAVSAEGGGTLVILRTASDTEAADLLGALLAETPGDGRLLIIPSGDQALDRIMTSRGRPSCGIQSYSSLRPILQVLPLLCELLWEPLDPYRLIEFLSLPDIPVPRWVARSLAEAVAKAPGIGGKPWMAALAKIEETARSNTADGDAAWASIRASIAAWIEGVRYPHNEGVPRETLLALARQVARWAGAKPLREEEDDSQITALAAQAGHLAMIAEFLPEPRIRKPQLQRLLLQIIGEGQSLGKKAEAGHQPWIGSPNVLIGPANEIIWWGFTHSDAPVFHRPPWLEAETAYLTAAGVILPDPLVELQLGITGYERAVYAAQKRLVLVMPECEAGAAVEPHPLYDRLSVIFGDTLGKLEVAGAKWLEGDSRLPAFSCGAVTERSIPKPRRFWHLADNDAPPPRATESYSSLSDLFEIPVSWVLKYEGRLREGPIQAISNIKAIMGSVAHRVFEELFPAGTDCKGWKQVTAEKHVDRILTHLIETEGIVFLQPVLVSEKQTLMRRIQRAAWEMAKHIRDNGWTVAGTEHAVSGTLVNQNLAGSVDLLLHKTDGALAVVDLKWGKSKYLRRNFLENRCNQLALYAHMLKKKRIVAAGRLFLFVGGAIGGA
jgi:RecB family exonuclease